MKKQQRTPEQDALEHIDACRDKPFLEERVIDSFKGRGVFTQQIIEPATFVVEYRGKLSSLKTRESRRKHEDTFNNYLYEFSWKGKRWCIDASKEDTTLGRIVNDDHINPNCEMKKVEYEGNPHLCLFALKEIALGEEITFNYGNSSYPWRSRQVAASCLDDEELLGHPKSKRGPNGKYKHKQAASSSDEHGSDNDDLAMKEKPKAIHQSRRNYCYVCGKGTVKIARHLERHADDEPDIAKVLALPKYSKERKSLLNDLRNRGDYKHNQKVLETNCGDLKAKRQTKSQTVSSETHEHCPYCKGFYRRTVMVSHLNKCPKFTCPPATCSKTNVFQESEVAESSSCKKPLSDRQKIMLSMPKDETTFMLKHDPILIQLTQSLSDKCAGCEEKHEDVKQTLRQAGRFLLALHGKSLFSFKDALKPDNFSKIVEAVKSFAGFNEKKQRYKKTSLAATLAQTLKEIANVAVSKTDDNEEVVRDAKSFITLCEEEWKELLSDKGEMPPSAQKVKSPATIPFTHEVQALYKCIETTLASAIVTMKKYESPQVYNALCRVILAQVALLNKGASWVSKLTLESFQKRDNATQVLSKHFVRINILSKDGRNAALLLTPELVEAMTLLVSKRATCGVHKDNALLFAKTDGSPSSFQSAGRCVRVFTKSCHAKNTEYLMSAHFQKHIARVCQILNLENDELEHLAKLLGHDICTEKSYYRQPDAAVELAKIAKLLLAMEKGSLENFKGKSLNEVAIEDQLEPDVEKANSKNHDGEESETCDLFPQWKDADKPDCQLTPEQDALKHIEACKDKPFLEGIFMDHFKGRGVFTHESIEASAFVVEYRGIISQIVRENNAGDAVNNYLFDFSWNGTNWRIDASAEDGSLGRLVNDEHKRPNCEMRKVVYEGKPHLCLFALKKISVGDEIMYNYGDSSYPWRSTVDNSSPAESCCDDADDDPRSDADDITSHNQHDLEKSGFSAEQSDDGSSVHPAGGHSYTQRNYCYICGKAPSKISRHLFTHRKQDAEIAAAFALPRLSKERAIRLGKLRNRGNWKHNQEVLKTRCGALKVMRRKPQGVITDGRTLAPCIYCKAVYSCAEMWRHVKRCSSRLLSSSSVNHQVLNWFAARVTETQGTSSTVEEMAKTLKGDVTPSVILTDSYLVLLAEYLCHNIKIKGKAFEHVKNSLQQMGRLLLLLRMKSVCSFEDAMKPENFSKFVEAVGQMPASSADTQNVSTLMRSLQIMGNIKYVRALKEDAGEEMVQEAEAFMALCEKELDIPLPSFKIRNARTIRFMRDVQLLYRVMEKTAESGVEGLNQHESLQVYNALSRVTLAQVSILNKNVQDISKVTLKSFHKWQDSGIQAGAAGCQSRFEQLLDKRFVKIQVNSKRGKRVSVMLTPEMLSAIMLLVSKREACGVHKKNSFLFARPGTLPSSFYRGKSCIATMVTWSGAKNLCHLKSPYFRKYMVKIFQILSLSKDELEELSRLLERNICTDPNYYRTPEAAGDIAKILQLVSAMEKGSIEEFAGKSLNEVELEDELQPDVEQISPESSDNEDDASEAESAPSAGKHGQGRTRKQERGSEDSELSDENDDVREDKSVMPAKETLRSRGDAAHVWFSDDEEDMNVDFDVDIDTDDDVRNEDKDGGGLSTPAVTRETQNRTQDTSESWDYSGSPAEHSPDPVEVMDTEDHKKDRETGVNQTEKHRHCSHVLSTVGEKRSKSSAAVTGMNEVKILIPKLQIENHAEPIHISQLSSLWPVENRVVLRNNKKRKASTSTDTKKRPDDAMDQEMSCSFCKRSITKGQTAFQKKGFTDVFCSKNCLFEMFPMNKSASKTCHYCLKVVTQMLELVMAVVDGKGTIKDFCSVLCLTSFKANAVSSLNTQPLCSMCNKPCTIVRELKINQVVHRFCGISCLESFRRSCIAVCKNCGSPCDRKVRLKLGDDVKLMCSPTCVQEFKENIKISIPCSRCHTLAPTSSMTVYKSSEDTVELLCARPCVTPEEPSHITVSSKTCYNCFETIKRPQNIILAPVDDLGEMRELCSEACLTSVKSKSSLALKGPTPQPVGPRSECRMCVRYSHCKFKVMLEGLAYNICSDTCLVNYYKVNNLPLLTCDLCSSFILEKRLVVNMEDDSKNICSEKCLVKFKEKVQTPQLCCVCRTRHQMSDMVEKEEKGSLNLFCSSRCMIVYKAPCVTEPEENKLAAKDDDVKEPKPSLPCLDYSKLKEEPVKDDYNEEVASSVPTQVIKDEPTVPKIASVLSLKGEPAPETPTFTHTDSPTSCASCKEALMNGETVYQKQSRSEIFCSTSCLFRFDQVTPLKKTCHFCLQELTQAQEVVQAPLVAGGTVKDFCSHACLSAFNLKTSMSPKTPIVPLRSHSQCDVCSRYGIIKHEVLDQDVMHQVCSDPCLRRFSNLKKMSTCANCQSRCSSCLTLSLERGSKLLCSTACLAQFKQSIQTPQPCALCRTSKLVADMCESRTSGDTVELFCSSACVMASRDHSASATAESSPVITSVMSLASALAKYRRSSSAQQGSLPGVQTKVVGHACVQTASREQRNKSTLCTPLVHNKGVCCTTQTVDADAQTEIFTPTVVVLPLPVPVYVPLPMNMYAQFTPQPVGLPLPLPVPMFLPEPTVTAMNEKLQPMQSDGNKGGDGQKDREETNGRDAQTQTDQHGSLGSHDEPHAQKSPPGSKQPSASHSQSPASPEKVCSKNKGWKRRLSSDAEEEDAAPKRSSKSKSRKHHRLKCRRGVEAWKRWVQWRQSQPAASTGSDVVPLKENILDCSASELNSCLCHFVGEVTRPDGERYSTSSLFYLCLSIQHHLFQNKRTENIFSDRTYKRFSTKFTEILKGFTPSVTDDGGYVQSRVEEEYLWECKQLGAYSPIVLLNTLLFFCCKYLGFATVEQHRRLSFACVTRCTRKKDGTKVAFLLFKLETDTNGVPAKKPKKNEAEVKKIKVMENPGNLLRCPVRLYDFYLSKCAESVKQRSDLFYLHPDDSCIPSSPLWFSSTPLDGGILEAMLVRMLNVREVQNVTDEQGSEV